MPVRATSIAWQPLQRAHPGGFRPLVELLLKQQCIYASIAIYLCKSTWFERNHLNEPDHKVKTREILLYKKPSILLFLKRYRKCKRVEKVTASRVAICNNDNAVKKEVKVLLYYIRQ